MCSLPAGKGLTSWLSCVFVTFPYGVLGQVWYLIVSIPDLCLLSYFYYVLVRIGANLYVYVADTAVSVYLGNVCSIINGSVISMSSPPSQRHKMIPQMLLRIIRIILTLKAPRKNASENIVC